MRAMRAVVSPWIRALGTLLIVVLPLLMVVAIRPYETVHASLMDFALVFFLVSLAAQAGLIVRRWGNIRILVLLVDLLLAAVAGLVSYEVLLVAVRRGGAMVNPSLIAVILAYLLALWSGQRG
jgi:hypothetical protein